MPEVGIGLLGGLSVVVDGRPVDGAHWSRRQAAGLVKLLALAPGRRLHREQVLDALWPDDDLDTGAPKLHKAAHYARRALGFPDALVLRDDAVVLAPTAAVLVDVVRFEEAAQAALARDDASAARAAADLCPGDLLPEDPYAEWLADRREHVRGLRLAVLRLGGEWGRVLELDPSDEAAHLALMRQHAANGDRHAALRQFERLDRTLRRELGVAPGPEAVALRDRLLEEATPVTTADHGLVGRENQLAALGRAVLDVAGGRSRTLLLVGEAGAGKSTLLAHLVEQARDAGLRTGQGSAAPVEGAWPFAPVIDALANLCRRHPSLLDGLPDHHRSELDAALSGQELTWEGGSSHQRLFVAAAELVRLAAGSRGLLLTVDDLHDADDASVRLLHFLARSTSDDRVLLAVTYRRGSLAPAAAQLVASLVDRHRATEVVLGPLTAPEVAELVRRHLPSPDPSLVDQILDASRGMPFAVEELARRAATEPAWMATLDAFLVGGIPPATREVLQRVAVLGTTFDTDEFVTLSSLPEGEAFEHLDVALSLWVVEPTDRGYRFRHSLVRDALLSDVPPHRRRLIHRDAALRLVELDASPARIGHHLLEAGSATEAVPYLLRTARTQASIGAYRDALAIADSLRPHATGSQRQELLLLRGDLLNALGDPAAASSFREALEDAPPEMTRLLRARLARASVMAGDLDTARAALEGLETLGDEADSDLLLARGNLAFFTFDQAMAEAAVAEAQQLILAGHLDWKVLDLVALQGLLAHLSGSWFDRMTTELRRTRDNPAVANAIFDGHLCAAEYLLYGVTPYADVIEVGRDLKRTAQRSGALRAAAFAAALIGEAALLSGDVDLAEAELVEARELHSDLGSPAGEAHSLQRLAEVHLARGDHEAANELLHRAMALARSSMVAHHLLQRIHGTLILAAPDPAHARAAVDRAESMLGWDEVCPFCTVMLAVPATIACARSGDVEHARHHLASAERSAMLWDGTSWEGGLAEARAAVALASGDREEATRLLAGAVELFARAGQPLDVERCRLALATV